VEEWHIQQVSEYATDRKPRP